jgi:CheY-like chemotaxis protein
VLQARDGTEALNILAEHRPDVIMLDLVMPNMDGFHLLTALKGSPALRDIPRIIISARDPTGQPIMCHALAVVQAGGISSHQLLACVHAMTQILSPALHAEPKPPVNRDA